MTLHGLHIPTQKINDFCRTHGVKRLWLFGSILRDDFTLNSDIDVLVESDPARPIGLFALAGLAADLQDTLGREVHITTLGGIPSDARPGLLAKAQLQYAA